MADSRRTRLVLATIALAALVFVNWHAWTTDVDITPIARAPIAERESPNLASLGLTAASLQLQPLLAYRETTARPLFNATRRPILAAIGSNTEARDQPPLSPEGFRVLGVVKEETGPARALIVTPEAPHGGWIEAGQEVGGWNLTEIGETAVTITSGGVSHRLTLYATPAPAAGQKLNAVRPR